MLLPSNAQRTLGNIRGDKIVTRVLAALLTMAGVGGWKGTVDVKFNGATQTGPSIVLISTHAVFFPFRSGNHRFFSSTFNEFVTPTLYSEHKNLRFFAPEGMKVMIQAISAKTLPPRNGGKVTIIAEGRVNPGEVSGDGKSVVFGGFEPGVGESVYRWRDGEVLKLNQDGYSSYQSRSNQDASVVVFHRYSLQDALDKKGNWNVGRWQDGKVEVVAGTDDHEMSPGTDDSGKTIVYDREDKQARKINIMQWKDGETSPVSEGKFVDLFAEVSGNGERTAWRRNLHEVWLQDQNGVDKALSTAGAKPASVSLDQSGDKVLYSAEDKEGDRDIFITDLSNSSTTVVANLKGVEEYDPDFSGDGKTVTYTAIDFRKKDMDLSSLKLSKNGDFEKLSEGVLAADMNVYVWRDGKTEQLTWDDGGLNTKATVSDDGNSVSWLWIDRQDTNNRKVLLWQKDPEQVG